MDEGYKTHFTRRKVKKLVTFEDTRIIGHLTKGVLVARELVERISYTSWDPDKEGIITKEILDE